MLTFDQRIINELQQLKTEYEQLKIKNENEVQQEIVQLRQTNDVSSSIGLTNFIDENEQEIHADLSFIKSERDLLIEQINQQKEEINATVEQRKVNFIEFDNGWSMFDLIQMFEEMVENLRKELNETNRNFDEEKQVEISS